MTETVSDPDRQSHELLDKHPIREVTVRHCRGSTAAPLRSSSPAITTMTTVDLSLNCIVKQG
jgi:hypothetical protein